MAEAVFSVDVWLSGREYLRAVQSCFASPRNVERAGDYTGFLFSLQLRWISSQKRLWQQQQMGILALSSNQRKNNGSSCQTQQKVCLSLIPYKQTES